MRVLPLVILLGACSSDVQSGYPALVQICKVAADCAKAGTEFQCLDGGCQIQPCDCSRACPVGLGCAQVGGPQGECLAAAASFVCDGG